MKIADAVEALAELVGFIEGGAVSWTWFGDPGPNTLKGISKHRDRLGDLLQALLEGEFVVGAFGADHVWRPIAGVSAGSIGLVWSEQPKPLQVGLGVQSSIAPQSPAVLDAVTLRLLARMFAITADANVEAQFGNFAFAVGAPIPGFPAAASLAGEIPAPPPAPTPGAPGAPALTITATKPKLLTGASSRTLSIDTPEMVWDCIRLATFLVRTWTAGAQGGLLARLDDHLFPMIGEPGGVIQPMPPVAAMTTPGTPARLPEVGDQRVARTGWPADVPVARPRARDRQRQRRVPRRLELLPARPVAGRVDAVATDDPEGRAAAGAQRADRRRGVPRHPRRRRERHNAVRAARRPRRRDRHAADPRADDGGRILQEGPPPAAGAANPRGALLPAGQHEWTIGAGQKIAVSANGDGYAVTLTGDAVTLPGVSDPSPTLKLSVGSDHLVRYHIGLPGSPELSLPPPLEPPPAEELFGAILEWVLGGLPAVDTPLGPLVTALTALVIAELKGEPSPQDVTDLLAAALSLASSGQDPILFGPLSVTVPKTAAAPFGLQLALGPIGVDDSPLPIHIGKAEIGAEVYLPGPTPTAPSFSATLTDIRLGETAAQMGGGVAASLVPDLNQTPGFRLKLEWDGMKEKFVVTGGGKIPVQLTLGPLEIASLIVDLRESSFSIAVDLAFQLSAIRVAAVELGVRIPFEGGEPEVFLRGLGVSMDASAVKLRGMFGEVTIVKGGQEVGKDYVGAAVVSVAGLFDLSAIGGYSQLPGTPASQGVPSTPGGPASLFVFAALRAPLGGPPFFFVTGIAGGFGYNRGLPATGKPGELDQHPFFKVMNGDIQIDGETSTALASLSANFQPAEDEHWIAGGVMFRSFGFINGKIVVTVAFGHDFSIGVIGMAAFGIDPIAYFELDLQAVVDEECVLVQAAISPHSYLLDPDFFSLRGGFALGVWHSGAHAGDFVLSIGGYHPQFVAPAHYPPVDRVGIKVSAYGLSLSVQCFFACTPKVLMAGASLSLSAEFGGIAAGLDVYVDVLIEWDPFSLRARIGIVVWFVFCGRHEIGVELEIHTPPFGGLATIDLALVSFEIEFGEPYNNLPRLPLHELFAGKLGVPATETSALGARMATFNTADEAGLFRIDVARGRSATQASGPAEESAAQVGVLVGDPLKVESEFELTLLTRLPLDMTLALGADGQPLPATISGGVLENAGGDVTVPLCKSADMESQISVSGLGSAAASWLADEFPAAIFGAALPTSDAIFAQIGGEHDEPTVHRVDGLSLIYDAQAGNREPPDGGRQSRVLRRGPGLPAPAGRRHGRRGRDRRRAGLDLRQGAGQRRLIRTAEAAGGTARGVADGDRRTRRAGAQDAVAHGRQRTPDRRDSARGDDGRGSATAHDRAGAAALARATP